MSVEDIDFEELKKDLATIDYSQLSREELNEAYDERSTLEKTLMAPVELATGALGGVADMLPRSINLGMDILDSTGLPEKIHDVASESTLVQNIASYLPNEVSNVPTGPNGEYRGYRAHTTSDMYEKATGNKGGVVDFGSMTTGILAGGALMRTTKPGMALMSKYKDASVLGKAGIEALTYAPAEILMSDPNGGFVLGGEDKSPLVNRAMSSAENVVLGFGLDWLARSSKSAYKNLMKVEDPLEGSLQKSKAMREKYGALLKEVTPSHVDVTDLPNPATLPIQPLNTQYDELNIRLTQLSKDLSSVGGKGRQKKKSMKILQDKIDATKYLRDAMREEASPSNPFIGDSITVKEDLYIRQDQVNLLKRQLEDVDKRPSISKRRRTSLTTKLSVAQRRLDEVQELSDGLDALEFDVNVTKAKSDPKFKAQLDSKVSKNLKDIATVSEIEKGQHKASKNRYVASGGNPQAGIIGRKPSLQETVDQRSTARQSVADYERMVDNFTEGSYTTEEAQEAVLDILEDYASRDIIPEITAVRELPFGPARAKAMRKVRATLRNNPNVLTDEDFIDKIKFEQVISDKLGLKKFKTTRSLATATDKILAYKNFNKKTSKALRDWSKDTGLAPKSILRVAGSIGVATEDLDSFILSATKLQDEMAQTVVDARNAFVKANKAKGDLDMASEEAMNFISAFLGHMDFYDKMGSIKGNLARSMRAMRESGNDVQSLVEASFQQHNKGLPSSKLNVYAKLKSKLEKVSKDTGAKFEGDLELEKMLEGIDPAGVKEIRDRYESLPAKRKERLTAEMYAMLESTRSKHGLRKMVNPKTGEEVLSLDGWDMFTSAMIGSMLSAPDTLSRIAGSTAMMGVYEEIMVPMFRGVIGSMRTRARKMGLSMISPSVHVDTPYAIMRRAVAGFKVATGHFVDRQNLGSRGVIGMNIEGLHAFSMKLPDMNKLIKEMGGSEKFVANAVKYPLAVFNMATRNALIPLDDFFRRITLEMERLASVDSLRLQLTSSTDNIMMKGVQVNPFHGMDETTFNETMTPLLKELGDKAVAVSKDTKLSIDKEFDKVFAKYGLEHEVHDPIKHNILFEYSYGEKQAAKIVAQQTTDDTIIGLASTSMAKGIRTNRTGRVGLSMMIPFMSSPLNIMDYALQVTPGLQPLSARFRKDVFGEATSQKARDTALARMMGGMTLTAGAIYWVSQHETVGQLRPEEREEAKQMGYGDYHTKVGDVWIDYSYLGPFKSIISAVASLHRAGDIGDQGMDKYMSVYAMAGLSAMQDTPQYSAVEDMDFFGGSEKVVSRILASKATMVGNIYNIRGINKPINLLRLEGEREQSAVESELEHIDQTEFMKYLDNYNRENPLYRLLRSTASDTKTYEKRTDLFNRSMFEHDPSLLGTMLKIGGVSNKPVKNDKAMELLANHGLLTKEFVDSFDKVEHFHLRNGESNLFKEKVWHGYEDPLVKDLRDMYYDRGAYKGWKDVGKWDTADKRKQLLMDMINSRKERVLNELHIGQLEVRRSKWQKLEDQKEMRKIGIDEDRRWKQENAEAKATGDLLRAQKELEIYE